ncbi:hypothetical protein GCM10020254_77420 [Streptomyces goshikiensis]
MGALRENAGDAEDRFITTVFMGSGLIFVGTLFASVAATGTVLDNDQGSQFGRHFAYTLLTTYAMRMAAVFVFATSTIGRKLGVLPPGRPVRVRGRPGPAGGRLLLPVERDDLPRLGADRQPVHPVRALRSLRGLRVIHARGGHSNGPAGRAGGGRAAHAGPGNHGAKGPGAVERTAPC